MHIYGDYFEIGDIQDATGIALGKRAVATVTNRDQRSASMNASAMTS